MAHRGLPLSVKKETVIITVPRKTWGWHLALARHWQLWLGDNALVCVVCVPVCCVGVGVCCVCVCGWVGVHV